MDTQEVFPLIAGAITVGRLKESDLQIDHASVSGRHATIEKFGETWTIKVCVPWIRWRFCIRRC